MRKPALETMKPQSFEKLELLYTLFKTGEKGALALCICNSPAYRKQLETKLAQRLKKDRIALHTLELKPGIVSIVRAIKETIDSLSPEPGWRLALSVSGIEGTIPEAEQNGEGRPKSLNSLNLQRDFFIDFPHPIVLWMPEWVANLLPAKAPDFWVVRTSVFECRPLGEEMQEYIRTTSDFALFYDSLEDIDRRIRIYQKMIAGYGKEEKAPTYLWLELGELFQIKGDMATAQRYIKEGLHLAQKENNKAALAASHHALGIIEYLNGNLDKAKQLHQEGLELYREMGDKYSIGASLHQLAMIEQDRGNLDKAETLCQDSLELFLNITDKGGISASFNQLGAIEYRRGNLDKAEEFYKESLKLARDIKNKWSIAGSLHQVAMIEQRRGNLDKAERLYQESLRLFCEIGDKRGIASGLNQFGSLYIAKQEYEKALHLIYIAMTLFSELGSPQKERTMNNMSKIMEKVGKEKFKEMMEHVPKMPITKLNVYLSNLINKNNQVLSHEKTSEKKNYA